MTFMTLSALRRVCASSLLLVLLAILTGCYSDPNPTSRHVFPGSQPAATVGSGNDVQPAGTTNQVPSRYSYLRVGDLVVISFSDIKDPIQKQEFNIPGGGMLTLPYNVHVKADGKTTTELEKEIRDAYVPSLFVNLTVSVRVEQRFYVVDGEVRQPGRVPYFGVMTVMRAIGSAGGFTDFAKRKAIELRRENGEKFTINYNKALKDSSLDLPVYPNDHIIVPRSSF